jgi:hypothetical protein
VGAGKEDSETLLELLRRTLRENELLHKTFQENNKKVQTSLSDFQARMNSNTTHRIIVTGLNELLKQSISSEYDLKLKNEELTNIIKLLESQLTAMAQKVQLGQAEILNSRKQVADFKRKRVILQNREKMSFDNPEVH